MKIAYLNGPRLRRALIAGSDHVERARQELNRINVFPVPDGDTGTNLALTLRALSDHLRSRNPAQVGEVSREAAEAAILGARGNSGMMISHFLLGVSKALSDRHRITPDQFSEALLAGVASLEGALDQPVEGTILTVMRDTARAAERLPPSDFHPYVRGLLEEARQSLERTPELLPALRDAGVVDAGAAGFVLLLEGVVDYITGGSLRGEGNPGTRARLSMLGEEDDPAAVATATFHADDTYRYCTEALVRGEALPDEATVREALRGEGDSLVVLRAGSVLKVHIHTDEPESVFARLRSWGTLAAHKAEDMHRQHETLVRSGGGAHGHKIRRAVALVTESATDLPAEVIRAHGITVIPLLLLEGSAVLRDGIDITSEAFHARLGETGPLPTTSQPAPGDFVKGFAAAEELGEEILYLGLSAALSGTYAAAEAASALRAGQGGAEAPLHRFDTRAASILQGLMVQRAAELAESGLSVPEILERLEAIRAHSGVMFTVDTFDRLLASGRVGRGKAFLGTMLKVKPILTLNDEGRIIQAGKARGRAALMTGVMERLGAAIPPGTLRPRFGIVHVARPQIVTELTAELQARWGPDVEILSAPVTPVLATHLGLGAWGLAWMVDPEDR